MQIIAKLKLCCTIALICSANILISQTNEGTNFWFGFMEHINPRQNTKVVLITAKENTEGTIRVPGLGFTQTFTVQANDVTSIEMPLDTEFVGSEEIKDIGINVTSTKPISVYIHQYHANRSEATLVLPVSSISNEYYVIAYTGISAGPGSGYSEFLVVATEDETAVEYRLTAATQGGGNSGSTETIILNQGETYQVKAATVSGDLTGSFVKADKAIAVFAGASFSGVQMHCSSYDNLLEMMPPLDTWGTRFVSAPTNEGDYDVFRILASENNTNIEIHSDGGAVQAIMLQQGGSYEYTSYDATYVEADNPIIIAQYLVGNSCTNDPGIIGDPSMLVLNSVEQLRDTVTLYNSRYENIESEYQFINIICRSNDIDIVTFDGALIQSELGFTFSLIGPEDAFAYVRIPTGEGAHTIINPGCGVIATAFGYGTRESYAYSGGASFNKINANQLPEGGCKDVEVFFSSGLPPERYDLEWDIGDGQATRFDDNFTYTYSDLGTFPAELRVFDNCFNERDTFNRNMIISLRQAVDAIDMIEVCEGEELIFEVQDNGVIPPGGRLSFEWIGPEDYFAEEQYPIIEDAKPSMSGIYEVIGIISGCATFPDYTEVTVNPTPVHDLGEDDVICEKNDKIPVLNGGDFASLLWSTGDTQQFIDADDEGTYYLEFTDGEGCTGVDSISFVRQCPTAIYMANAFSPESAILLDNETFGVQGEDIISFRLEIFDRWGNIIFATTDIDNNWDGKLNGKFVDRGNYPWLLQFEGYDDNGTTFQDNMTGTVLLLK